MSMIKNVVSTLVVGSDIELLFYHDVQLFLTQSANDLISIAHHHSFVSCGECISLGFLTCEHEV